MIAALRSVVVAEATAAALEEKAAAHGVTVAVLLAEWLALDELSPRDDPASIIELDKRWEAVRKGKGAPTVLQGEVERWLETWGTPAFRGWRDR